MLQVDAHGEGGAYQLGCLPKVTVTDRLPVTVTQSQCIDKVIMT